MFFIIVALVACLMLPGISISIARQQGRRAPFPRFWLAFPVALSALSALVEVLRRRLSICENYGSLCGPESAVYQNLPQGQKIPAAMGFGSNNALAGGVVLLLIVLLVSAFLSVRYWRKGMV